MNTGDGWAWYCFDEHECGPWCQCLQHFYFGGQRGAINKLEYEMRYDPHCVQCGGRGRPTIPWGEL